MPWALNSCPNYNKSPNLVTLIATQQTNFDSTIFIFKNWFPRPHDKIWKFVLNNKKGNFKSLFERRELCSVVVEIELWMSRSPGRLLPTANACILSWWKESWTPLTRSNELWFISGIQNIRFRNKSFQIT